MDTGRMRGYRSADNDKMIDVIVMGSYGNRNPRVKRKENKEDCMNTETEGACTYVRGENPGDAKTEY